MAILTVQQEVWDWEWEQTETAPGVIPPSPCIRRREKIETINYPPLGTSIPVNIFLYNLLYILFGA